MHVYISICVRACALDCSHVSLIALASFNAAPITLSGTNDPNATNLKACTGECDNDDQCRPGLKCFQRSNGEAIPGCTGAG